VLFLPFQSADWRRIQSRKDGQEGVEVVDFPQVLQHRVKEFIRGIQGATYFHNLQESDKVLLPFFGILLLKDSSAAPIGHFVEMLSELSQLRAVLF
jgi:hypothetical protein